MVLVYRCGRMQSIGMAMHKRILVITASARPVSNSEILADEFARGAREAGHQVEKIRLRDKDMHFCNGCYDCEADEHRCSQHDDVAPILDKMADADVIVFATPIYFYEMSGRLKTLLDRTMPIYFRPCRFSEVYFIAAGTDSNETAMQAAINGVQAWISCFSDARLAGTIRGAGASMPGDARTHSAFHRAYVAGRSA